MKNVRALFLCSLLAVSTGCIAAPVVPPLGLLYTDFEAPMSITGTPAQRRGESSVTAWLALFSTGDGSVKAAAQAGGISNVTMVDYKFRNILGIYQRYTTIVYGN